MKLGQSLANKMGLGQTPANKMTVFSYTEHRFFYFCDCLRRCGL